MDAPDTQEVDPKMVKITIEGVEHDFPVLDELTLGEAAALTDLLGMQLDDARARLDVRDPRWTMAIVYVIQHRLDEAFTQDDARNVRSAAVSERVVKDGVEEETPVPPAPGGAAESLNGSAEIAERDIGQVEIPVEHGPPLSSGSIK